MPAQVHANLAVVIDTNIVLDMFVFSDPRCAALHAALDARHLHWIATQVMRDELERVLDYSHLQGRMDFYKTTKLQVLAAFDARVKLQDTATRCVYICKDEDDQKFIDLSAAHQALLLSKDKAVLCMRKRMALLGVTIAQTFPAAT